MDNTGGQPKDGIWLIDEVTEDARSKVSLLTGWIENIKTTDMGSSILANAANKERKNVRRGTVI